jgi:hypothetical protein
MNMGKTAIVLLAFLLAGMIAAPSFAADVQNLNITPVGNVISEQRDQQPNDITHDFTLSGNNILWRGGEGGGGALYLYSLNDHSTRTIATKTSPGSSTSGIIDGYAVSDGTVVWSDRDSTLYEYDIASGKTRNIPDANTTGSQKTYSWNGIKGVQRWEPAMYGDRVVWFQGYPSGTYRAADVAFLNTTTNVVTLISESPTGKDSLAIDGDNVIWCAYDENVTNAGTHNSIFLHNLVTGNDTVVSSDTGLKRQAALSGDYVGWTDFGDPLATPRLPTKVHIYTISSGTARTVPAASMDQELNFIAGDYAFYTECTPSTQNTNERSCESKMYDIKTGSTWQLPSSLSGRQVVGYSDGLILVEDDRGNVPELLLFRTDDLRPVPTETAATQTPAPAETKETAPVITTIPESTAQASPGFGSAGMVAALVVLCGIAGKTILPPQGRF